MLTFRYGAARYGCTGGDRIYLSPKTFFRCRVATQSHCEDLLGGFLLRFDGAAPKIEIRFEIATTIFLFRNRDEKEKRKRKNHHPALVQTEKEMLPTVHQRTQS